jgi:hypothetical protein
VTWARFDDGFFDREEIVALSHAAYRLHTGCLIWSGRTLTDGRLSRQAVRSVAALGSIDDIDAVTQELVGAGLWQAQPEGFRIVAWEDHLRPKAIVERERAEARKRMKDLRSSERSGARSRERSGEQSKNFARSSGTPTRGSSRTSDGSAPPQETAAAEQWARTVGWQFEKKHRPAALEAAFPGLDERHVDGVLAIAAEIADDEPSLR